MVDRVEELIKEVAVKHGIALGRDDPILILQTINARLLEDGEAAQRVLLQTHKEELEAIAQRWGLDAKDKAERILSAGLNASKEAMGQTMGRLMQDSLAVVTDAVETKVRYEVSAALDGVHASVDQARTLARMNLISAAITLIAAAIALWATVR